MSGFDELEESLMPLPRKAIDEVAREEMVDALFCEPPDPKPELQWSWRPFEAAVSDVREVVLAPFRFLTRLMPRG